jgi:hypothetical protein
MIGKTTIQNSVVKTLYTIGQIYRQDLVKLLTPHSKSPERYLTKLLSTGVCEYNTKNKVISLSKETIKSYSSILKFKPSKTLIDNHDFITSQVLLWLFENQDVEDSKVEVKIDNTSLKADLYVKLKNGFELYIEADTGNERVTELRNKVLNYSNLESKNKIVIIVTQSKASYEKLIELTVNKQLFKICLDNNIIQNLENIDNSFEINVNSENTRINNNINHNLTSNIDKSIKLTLEQIQKLITSY